MIKPDAGTGLERKVENPTIDVVDQLAVKVGGPNAKFFAEPSLGANPSKPLKVGRRPSS
jgi:hypothetical protein